MKLKKKIPVIDQADKLGFWGGKFGGNFCAETLKKPIEDLEMLFNKLKNNKSFINERDKYFKDWIRSQLDLLNLTILQNMWEVLKSGPKLFLMQMVVPIKFITLLCIVY